MRRLFSLFNCWRTSASIRSYAKRFTRSALASTQQRLKWLKHAPPSLRLGRRQVRRIFQPFLESLLQRRNQLRRTRASSELSRDVERRSTYGLRTCLCDVSQSLKASVCTHHHLSVGCVDRSSQAQARREETRALVTMPRPVQIEIIKHLWALRK